MLGILKKAEAKSAVMVVVAVFAIPALNSVIWDIVRESLYSKLAILISAGIFCSLLIFGVLGAVHLGQAHFRKLLKENCDAIGGKELQRVLVHDMLRKESVLDQTLWLGFLAFAFVLIALVLSSDEIRLFFGSIV